MKYLLDTNICIYLMNRTRPKLAERIVLHNPEDIGISAISASELAYGVEKSKQREKASTALAQMLAVIQVLPFDQSAVAAYGRIRAQLESQGNSIGPLDTLIAAHAQALRATVVTNNTREFSRVQDLGVLDWTE